jgi:DNA invertase Pin-like site-specific DNA recombinase
MSKVRCAIYTRKSSEEGLEQDFNSLHAQREACAAYILSQASEGWSLLKDEYDDGGLSGGTLERPALQRLLADIAAGKIDIVVVYKVDRLTRSLLDFAKLVEALDKAGTSFVAVTQSFNTTTSMGRLTLNMLLSFAQFEREVTAERIRDKIAASKAKGMWMGGVPPLGYKPDGRTLAIVPEHAELIRQLFRRYREIRNVRLLTEQLAAEGIHVPERAASTGRKLGGGAFTRGQIYKILSNPIYLGEIHHKGQVYPGKHEAIVTRELWDEVQARLRNNTQGSQGAATIQSSSLLAGLVSDEAGEPLVATHACKGNIRYRYYVSRALQHRSTDQEHGLRVPALELEKAVTEAIATQFDNPLALAARLGTELTPALVLTVTRSAQVCVEQLRQRERSLVRMLVTTIQVLAESIQVELKPDAVAQVLGVQRGAASLGPLEVTINARLARSGLAVKLIGSNGRAAASAEPASKLIALIIRARTWWAELANGETDLSTLARCEQIGTSYISRVLRLNFLSPEIVEAILSGKQPVHLDAARLQTPGAVAERWSTQRLELGFA